MIVSEYGKFTLVCDVCGEEVDNFDSFDDALTYIQQNGWESDFGETLDLQDDIIDICPNCLEE